MIARPSSPSHLAAFYRALSRLVAAGIPPAQAALSLDSAGTAGLPQAHAAALTAGEASGTLDTVLAQLADGLEAETSRRREALSLFLRPALVLLACALVSPLPALVTGGPMAYLRGALPLLLLLAACTTLAGSVFDALRSGTRSLVAGLPAIRDLVLLAARARACRMTGLLVGAGLPMPVALRMAGHVGGSVVATTFDRAARRVESGAGLASALQHAGALDAASIAWVAAGEAAGRLDGAFPQAATLLEDELDRTLRWRFRIASGSLYVLSVAIVAWRALATFAGVGVLAE